MWTEGHAAQKLCTKQYDTKVEKVKQRWVVLVKSQGAWRGKGLGYEIRPLTLPDLRGSLGIKVFRGFHGRKERHGGRVGAESTECSFPEALGITCWGWGCCSRWEAGHWPGWQVGTRAILWVTGAFSGHRLATSDHSNSAHCPSADSSRAGTLCLWSSGPLAPSTAWQWTSTWKGFAGLMRGPTTQTAAQFRAYGSPKGVSPSVLIS